MKERPSALRPFRYCTEFIVFTPNGSTPLQEYMASLSILYQNQRKDSHRAANLDRFMFLFVLVRRIMIL